MKAQSGKTGKGAHSPMLRRQKRNTVKGTSTTSHWRATGRTDVKLGYGGEKYPTQEQVKKKVAKRAAATKKGAEGPKKSSPVKKRAR
jgi:hypothetical protein